MRIGFSSLLKKKTIGILFLAPGKDRYRIIEFRSVLGHPVRRGAAAEAAVADRSVRYRIHRTAVARAGLPLESAITLLLLAAVAVLHRPQ